MPNTFGFGTDTTGFSSTVHDAIQAKVIETLRAGLVSLPRGAVVPATIVNQSGENFTLRHTAYPDLVGTAFTAPLTEGTAPSALKLGIDVQDFTVQQSGARVVVTDVAEMQSPHPLDTIAAEKIARLAADNIDGIGRTALAALTTTNDYGQPLSTSILLDMIAAAQAVDLEPIPGVGYYFAMHPSALRGLTGEDGINGYVNVTADGNFTKNAVGQYRGATFLVSSKFTDTAGNFPIYLISGNSIAAGDLSSVQYINWSAAGVGNELQQLKGFGYKGVLGCAVLNLSEVTDGSGTNGSTVPRVMRFGVSTGVSN